MNKKNNSISSSHLVLYITIGLFLVNICINFFIPGGDTKVKLSDFFLAFLNLATVISIWLASKKLKRISERLSKGWGILCFAQLLFTIGDFLWAYYEVILKINPFPSVADFFYLSFYPIFLIGILLLIQKEESKIQQINNWLDIGMIFISASIFLGVFLLSPMLGDLQEESVYVQILNLAYPVGDLFLFSALLILIYHKQKKQLGFPILFIAISLLIQIATDIIFSYQSLMGTYISGGWLDSGWALGYLLLGIAGFLQSTLPMSSEKDNLNQESRAIKKSLFPNSLRNLLPYLLIALAYSFLFKNYQNKEYVHMNGLFIGVGLLIILVLTRQLLALWQNNQLTTNLNKVVEKIRSQALLVNKINDELLLEIEERKKAESQISFNSLHDALTKLPNRALFIDRLEHAIEYSKRYKEYKFSVFFLDIDHFKNVNDSMGHTIGDELIVLFTERLNKHIRKSDTFARLGGDEFAILLENNSIKKTSIMFAERILESLRSPYKIAETNLYISASIGIVENSKEYNNSKDILQDADFAMYRAKTLGNARFVVFTTDLRDEAISRLDLESQLREGIDKNEFLLYYQPIYSLLKKSLKGFEALLRWNHPKRGILTPADFLTVAEDSGIIEKIDEWVLFQACQQMKNWHDKFPQYQNLVININLSGRRFKHTGFIGSLKTAINDTGLKAEKICLEITETTLIENKYHAIEIFKSLHEMGVKIHIDDFGTGYSSLSYLQQFPVDTIKIDKSFISSMGKDKKGDQLVQTIITMAQNLGINVIAEGIETRKQLNSLKSMSCQYGQGYYLSYPLPSSEIDLLIRSE
ncbi:MAG: bifunctional diguanylate cyclase/phosphodiesterase [Anaerolineaceae bacterium]|nr:bifunctional diguanylate cyclase/phosphodiesterase [Anaerolineaceae bacterium]